MTWRIRKLSYSVDPWRVVNDDGQQMWRWTHLDTASGPTSTQLAVAAPTKQALVDLILDEWGALLAEVADLRDEADEANDRISDLYMEIAKMRDHGRGARRLLEDGDTFAALRALDALIAGAPAKAST